MKRLLLLALSSLWLSPGVALAQADASSSERVKAVDVAAEGPFSVLYDARIVPSEKVAYVRIVLDKNAHHVDMFSFRIDPERQLDFDGDGEIELSGDRVNWKPPKKGGELRYTFRIDHLRDAQRYDARVTSTWALFRGDDLVPPARVDMLEGAYSESRLRLRLPEGWKAVSPYPVEPSGTLRIDNPERLFDRPTGWFLVGKLSISRTTVEGMKITVATPSKQGDRRQDLLAFLRYTLPELKPLVGGLPERLTIVSAGDPMWRGGLSGPGSLYLHRERPLIDTDFTSPILHEIVHTAMGARSGPDGDWIVEGIAELFGLEALVRSKGISKSRYRRALEKAKEKGAGVTDLLVPRADAKVTARAVVVLHELDQLMQERCEAKLSDVVARMRATRGAVTTASFRALAEEVGRCELSDFFDKHTPGTGARTPPGIEPASRPSTPVPVP